jgi:hypothetical protein
MLNIKYITTNIDGKDFARPDRLPETPPRTSTIRLEAVYLYGTDEMSTKDVLKYFDAYGPSHVEWIDDSSCNIVFPDQFSAKRAVYFQLVDKENITFGEDGDDDDIEPSRETSESGVAEPIISPKSKNRLQRAKEYVPVQQHNQITTAKSNSGLFVRYATDLDRKERHSAAKSVYYAIHGREDGPSTGQRSSTTTSSRYGRRSRADEDEVWNRGRGIQTMSRLRRRMEGASPSPSPTRRSWSRGRRQSGSRSSSGSRSGSYSRSRSPRRSARRDHGSRSPDARDRLRSDDYEYVFSCMSMLCHFYCRSPY